MFILYKRQYIVLIVYLLSVFTQAVCLESHRTDATIEKKDEALPRCMDYTGLPIEAEPRTSEFFLFKGIVIPSRRL